MDDKEFLCALREFIEETQVDLDGEFGIGRSLKELISSGSMPDVYFEVIRRINAA
jgi:8-oxo-dGTP pyrophosphatase MutT (NUDIX family)